MRWETKEKPPSWVLSSFEKPNEIPADNALTFLVRPGPPHLRPIGHRRPRPFPLRAKFQSTQMGWWGVLVGVPWLPASNANQQGAAVLRSTHMLSRRHVIVLQGAHMSRPQGASATSTSSARPGSKSFPVPLVNAHVDLARAWVGIVGRMRVLWVKPKEKLDLQGNFITLGCIVYVGWASHALHFYLKGHCTSQVVRSPG